MAVTLTTRFAIHRWPDDDDDWSRADFDSDNAAVEALAAQAVQGVYASLPAAGVQRRFYLATDSERLLIDDGDEWLEVGLLSTANIWTASQRHTAALVADAGISATDGTVEVSGNLTVSGSVTSTGTPLATATALNDHIVDTTSAHVASAIAFTPAGDVAATDVQAAIAELASEKGTAAALTTHKTAAGDHTAANITNVAAGSIAATTVQAAIDELATEKAPAASPIFTGTVTNSGTLAHTGALVGFYNTAPIAKPGAYATSGAADRTLAAYVTDTESVAYSVAPGTLPDALSMVDGNALRVAYENLRTAHDDLRGLVIGLTTDVKALGLIG